MAGYIIAALPLTMLALLAVIAPGFASPLADGRVSLLGMPAGAYLIAMVVLLAIIAIQTVRFVRQPWIVAPVLLLATWLGLSLIAFGPALVLIMINLKT